MQFQPINEEYLPNISLEVRELDFFNFNMMSHPDYFIFSSWNNLSEKIKGFNLLEGE